MPLWLITYGEDVDMVGGKGAGAAALLCVLTVTGCTAQASTPSPSPAPTSAASSTETARERQERLDYAAAENAYRTFRAEFNRVLKSGGAKQATEIMSESGTGSYLQETLEVVQAYRGLGLHQVGDERTVYVRYAGYSTNELNLEACEDTTRVRTIDANRKVHGRGELRRVEVTVVRTSGSWKLAQGSGRKVSSCD